MLKNMRKQIKLEKRLIKLFHKKGLLKYIDYDKIAWKYSDDSNELVLCYETYRGEFYIGCDEIYVDIIYKEYFETDLWLKIELQSAYNFIKYFKSKPTVINNNRIRKYIKINRKEL